MAREASSVQKPTCAGRFRSVGVLTAALLILTACGSGQPADMAMARKSYALMTQPPASGSSPLGPTEPAECDVFHRSWQHEAQLDLSMGFALGEVSNLGDHGVGMILFDVRSAPRDTLAKADFDYSQ